MFVKAPIRGCDQALVKALLIDSTFVATYQQDGAAIQIKSKRHAPHLSFPRKTQFLHVGVLEPL